MYSSNAHGHGFTLPFIHSHVRFDCGFDFLYIYNLYIQQNQIANPFIQIFVQYCMGVHVCECVCCVYVKLFLPREFVSVYAQTRCHTCTHSVLVLFILAVWCKTKYQGGIGKYSNYLVKLILYVLPDVFTLALSHCTLLGIVGIYQAVHPGPRYSQCIAICT